MAEAIRDQNHVPTKLGVLFSDGVTLIPIKIDATTGAMFINQSDTISQAAKNIAPRDANYEAAWMGEDSVTGDPVPIYVDSDGAVLIDL